MGRFEVGDAVSIRAEGEIVTVAIEAISEGGKVITVRFPDGARFPLHCSQLVAMRRAACLS